MPSTTCALDTFESQGTFRVLLDTLARPGRVRTLPTGVPRPPAPAALAVPLALADLGQRVAVVGDENGGLIDGVAGRWAAMVRDATSCAIVRIEEADLVVVLAGAAEADLIERLRRGSPLAPEQGCRLVLACDRLVAGSPGAVAVTLRGPGVPDVAVLGIDGIDAEVLAAVALANTAFPCGIDTWLVSGRGEVAGIPRSTTLEVR
ncbi:MAG: phosphonate C-P lyase system protein PhnH [Acidimicrobiia bacterium]|jgi:alpha-D-ribose 1-methylphosphonate 5-triphosphate synthase subunit PhnH|nr:phosphonate C-P lyase system protein PhnH [Acidimicrobiia bacterium]